MESKKKCESCQCVYGRMEGKIEYRLRKVCINRVCVCVCERGDLKQRKGDDVKNNESSGCLKKKIRIIIKTKEP